jgi:hypothetical protein
MRLAAPAGFLHHVSGLGVLGQKQHRALALCFRHAGRRCGPELRLGFDNRLHGVRYSSAVLMSKGGARDSEKGPEGDGPEARNDQPDRAGQPT